MPSTSTTLPPPTIDSLANQLSQLLRPTLKPEEMEQVLLRNPSCTQPYLCHSGGFCDSKMVLHEVFSRSTTTRPEGCNEDAIQSKDRVDLPHAVKSALRSNMVDIVDSKTRSRMMSGIRGKNTKPEVQVRKALTFKGYRYRLNCKDLPGKPDIVMPGRRIAIFVHGCFWHQHAGCRLAKMPSTRPEFWAAKLGANVARDRNAVSLLIDQGWRVLQVWECATKSLERLQTLPDTLTGWIEGAEPLGDISA